MDARSIGELKRLLRERLNEVRASVRKCQEEVLHIEMELRALDSALTSEVVQSSPPARVYVPPLDAKSLSSIKSSSENQFPLDKVCGMKQLGAAIIVAKHYGGVLRTADLIKILKAAGLMKKNTKNAGSMVFGLINNSGLFERVATGTYKLIEAEEEPSNSQEHFLASGRIQ